MINIGVTADMFLLHFTARHRFQSLHSHLTLPDVGMLKLPHRKLRRLVKLLFNFILLGLELFGSPRSRDLGNFRNTWHC